MKRWVAAGIVLMGWVFAGGGAVRAEELPASELTAYTARLTGELRARDAQAAELFEQANTARDANDLALAERLYRDVLRRQPGFHHATRRLASVVLSQGRRDEALSLARQAVQADRCSENRVALAHVLVATAGNEPPPPEQDVSEALTLARDLMRAEPHPDQHALMVAGQVALAGQDLPLLRQVATRLQRDRPQDPYGYYLRWVLAMSEREWGVAEELVRAASQAGLPAEAVARMREATAQALPLPLRAWRRAWPWGAAWLTTFALLLAAGFLLSAVVARSAVRLANNPRLPSSAPMSVLRRLYRVVLWASCIFYYVSMPLVLATVVALTAAILYACYLAGRIPVRLVLVVLVVAGATVWAAVKGLLARGRDADPGDRLDLASEPRLRELLNDLATRLDTRPVDSVYLTPSADVAVVERGAPARHRPRHALRGPCQRHAERGDQGQGIPGKPLPLRACRSARRRHLAPEARRGPPRQAFGLRHAPAASAAVRLGPNRGREPELARGGATCGSLGALRQPRSA